MKKSKLTGPTNAEVRKALKGSIAKWEGIVAGTIKDEGVDNCPLCQMFFDRTKRYYCVGCPVSVDTGNDLCDGSPYEKWIGPGNTASSINEIRLAQQELDYLKSLDKKFFRK